jgi:peptide-methionine (S)-S-oxide reductase
VEAVRVTYDPKRVSYEDLIQIFWGNHNPTQGNGQGVNLGSQYLAAVFFHDAEQEAIAIASRDALQQSGHVPGPITTQILAATDFIVAEEYHQQYYEKQGLVKPRGN